MGYLKYFQMRWCDNWHLFQNNLEGEKKKKPGGRVRGVAKTRLGSTEFLYAVFSTFVSYFWKLPK